MPQLLKSEVLFFRRIKRIAASVAFVALNLSGAFSQNCPPKPAIPQVEVKQVPYCEQTGSISFREPLVDAGTIVEYSIVPYHWYSSPIFPRVHPGEYKAKIRFRNASGCIVESDEKIVKITPGSPLPIPTLPTLSVSPIPCNSRYGTIIASGSVGSENTTLLYSINGGGWGADSVFQNMQAGTHNVRVMAARHTISDCHSEPSEPVYITLAPAPVITPPSSPVVDAPNIPCGSNETIVTVNDPVPPIGTTLEYSIDFNKTWQAGKTFSVPEGVYAISSRIKDRAGCYSAPSQGTWFRIDKLTVSPDIPVPGTPVVTVKDISCGLPSGSLSVSVPNSPAGTVPEYSIKKDVWQTGPDFLNLPAGIYSVGIRQRSSNGCYSGTSNLMWVSVKTLDTSPDIPKPAAPTVNITHIGCGNVSGSISVTGPAAPVGTSLEYSLNRGAWQTSNRFSGLAEGVYSIGIRARNNAGCLSEASELTWVRIQTVTASTGVPKPALPTVVVTDIPCGSNSGGVITVTGPSPSPGVTFEYSIRGGEWQVGNTFAGLPAGLYAVGVRAKNSTGCFTEPSELTWVRVNALTISSNIPKPPLPQVSINAACGSQATLTVTQPEAVPGFILEFSLDNGNWQTSAAFSGIASGVHSVAVRVKNNSGCYSPSSEALWVRVPPTGPPSAPAVAAKGSTTLCSGSVVLETVGSGIQWYRNGVAIPGETANSLTATGSGTYAAALKNECGVSGFSNSIAVSIGIPAPPLISTPGGTMICKGQNIDLVATGEGITWYRNDIVVGNGNRFVTTTPGFYTATATNGCGTSQRSNIISLKPNLLALKKSRFQEVSREVPAIDTATAYAQAAEQTAEQVAISCESQADSWMTALDSGLLDYPDKREVLRAELIAVCKAGGDMQHFLGANTSPKPTTSGYSSFGEVIKGVLGINQFTPALNPWLIDAPLPHGTTQQATEKVIAYSNPDLCTKLEQLQNDHRSEQPSVSFYQYLKNKFNEAMVLSVDELADLTKSCTNCKYLLASDIQLPVFLEPGAKGYITGAEFNDAKDALIAEFLGNLPSDDTNYETIFSNYMNHRWGFALTYDQYTAYSDSLRVNPTALLVNKPPYATIEVDPYNDVKSLMAAAVAVGQREHAIYIEEEKQKFRASYVIVCGSAPANVKVSAKQQIYHYTLYYYDQADNLVRTVPPEGVQLLSDPEMKWASEARNFDPSDCSASYDGPANNAKKDILLQDLSNALSAKSQRAIEMWWHSEDTTANQLIATTPDRKFMYQACISSNQLNVDIYSILQDSTGAIRFILSNHAAGDIAPLKPLHPWKHLVVQSDSLASGSLLLYLNGTSLATVTSTAGSGCGWEVDNRNNSIVMPENLAVLKHMRLYNRRMSNLEIAGNAANGCFMISPDYKNDLQPNLLAWHRFNLPAAGSPTTIADNSTQESKYASVYPDHKLTTTYVYNSTNQVIKQYTPDGGTSRFWYDYLSRLAVSQNAKQLKSDDFSYTAYDAIGRIVEVGEKKLSGSGLSEPDYLSNETYTAFLAGGANSQITQTYYDSIPEPVNGIQDLKQENLRKRVAASVYRETQNGRALQASYYDYDLAGNVKTLWQQVNGLGHKQMDYEYDLVSGKVNFVRYQHGKPDQFYYQYKYDAENRLTEAWSGTNALVDSVGNSYLLNGEMDASYEYYLHGPLARVELGGQYNKVQGLDYAYTLQGWLKGVNGQLLDPNKEIGKDGISGSTIARDAYAYSLGYYSGDYKPIGADAGAFGMEYQSQPGDITGKSLYNGNISNTTVAISKFGNGDPVGYTYRYDQLNRLKEMSQHLLSAGTSWNTGSITDNYKESISYDGNGNILSYLRNGTSESGKPLAMDKLTYAYNRDENGRLTDNRLRHVKDAVTFENYTEDLDSQPDDNFTYDEIGNLTEDTQEGLTKIDWTVYGKIKSISKADGKTISYTYDPSGNRVSKSISSPNGGGREGVGLTTWYVRDAQGNTLGVYENFNCEQIWKEQQLYGSNRLGIWMPNITLDTLRNYAVWDSIGRKNYELSNHLGNVLAVVTDKKLQQANGNDLDFYLSDVVSAQDYYPFGMLQAGRSWSLGDGYRYGAQGQEIVGELGKGHYTAKYWEYDARTGRRWNRDPVVDHSISLYATNENNPVKNNDPDGDCSTCPPTQVNVGIGLTLGSHNNGVIFNASITQQMGNWNVSAGIGATGYRTFANTGKGGLELRGSFQGGFNDGNTAVSLGTNVFKGLDGMSRFNQRTGILNIRVGEFSASYENDGMPFALGQEGLKAWAGDGDDKFRTAAVRLGFGEFTAGFNLFTGSRTNYIGDNEKVGIMKRGQFGERMPNGFVNETGTPFRMGGAFLGYGATKLGIDSDRWIRHPIQDNFAHNMPGTRQPGFQSLSKAINPFFQTSSMPQGAAPRFTLYDY